MSSRKKIRGTRLDGFFRRVKENEKEKKRGVSKAVYDDDVEDEWEPTFDTSHKKTGVDIYNELMTNVDDVADMNAARRKAQVSDIITTSAKMDGRDIFVDNKSKTELLRKRTRQEGEISKDEITPQERAAELKKLKDDLVKKKSSEYKGYHSSDTDDEEKLKEQSIEQDIQANAPRFVRTGKVPNMLSEVKETKQPDAKFKQVFDDIHSRDDEDFMAPMKRCSKRGEKHLPEAMEICKSMIRHISRPDLCMSLIARWHKSRIMPDIDEEMEDMFLLAHILFSDIKLEVATNVGYILFDTITNIYDIIKPQLYMKREYSVAKHRFAVPPEMISSIWGVGVIKFLYSKCFYRPRGVDSSGYIAEVVNFAHNDMLHEYSGPVRTNLIMAQIYFKLRMKLGNEVEFKKTQLAFKRSIDTLIVLMYTHKRVEFVPREAIECVNALSNIIMNENMYNVMSRNVFLFYKEVDIERRQKILDVCQSKLPPSKLEYVA